MIIKTKDKFAKQDQLRIRMPMREEDKFDYVGMGKVFDIIIKPHSIVDLIVDINLDPEAGESRK
jgi:hypothetical protein